MSILRRKIEELTQSNQELSNRSQIEKSIAKSDESGLVEKEYIAKLLRSLFEKDGQPQLQQQILGILCNSVGLVISCPQTATCQNGGSVTNEAKGAAQMQSLGDLWVNYLINKAQQPDK